MHRILIGLLMVPCLWIGCENNSTEPEQSAITGKVRDIDGNVYTTLKIGNQWWMAKNLRVTHYRNGEAIPLVTGLYPEWDLLRTGAYCYYDNNLICADAYGHLYNWYAVNDGRGLAPEGWHVPTDEEWKTLSDYLGGSSVAGGKLKEAGDAHWEFPNEGATNESDFTALPGGYRLEYSTYPHKGWYAWFWSTTINTDDSLKVWFRQLKYSYSEIIRSCFYKYAGGSVRCVKD